MLQNFNIYTKIDNTINKNSDMGMKFMTKKERILIITICITLLIISICYVAISINKTKLEEPLILKSNNEHPVLYKGKKIIEVYEEININNLTDYDRKLLREGIIINNDKELLSILEDYD